MSKCPDRRKSACPNCGRPDWCQQFANGGYMCRRGPGEGLEERKDRNGVPYWRTVTAGAKSLRLAPSRPEIEPACPADLHRVYGTILDRLELTEEHLAGWLRRGASADVVQRHRVRSWPAARDARRTLAADLYREFGDLCRRVPGWYVRDGRPMLAGGSGWVIPLWDLSGYVVALRVRSDIHDPDDPAAGPKYYWLSSARHGGTSPGSHARLAWPGRAPRPDDTADTVRVTEGEAKSIVLAEHTGVPTLSVPGVAMWTLALPWLRWLRARQVLLCYDADFAENKDVARALLAARRGFPAAGCQTRLETWRQA